MRINKEFVFGNYEDAARFLLPALRDQASFQQRDKPNYKAELHEVNFLTYHLLHPEQWHSSSSTFVAQPIWMANELVSEILALNPQLMMKYRRDLMEWSYQPVLQDRGKQLRYTLYSKLLIPARKI